MLNHIQLKNSDLFDSLENLSEDYGTITDCQNYFPIYNTLFDIKSNDDGTWRRIRVCDFMSKFLDKPYENEDKFPRDSFPHQFSIDKNIDSKFARWAPVLMSMLVNKSYENQGNVMDCKIVMSSSDKYREGQD